ncbi:unnamed protein product [Strongylus vulgaris]|uniref:Uncharacterized protein n=1 Tax=Strongylus vulgaris TaxID=40348 RepID=A0A3P7IP10_STRVU|nr:unnamed protein product [Strongylus vulgaris]
MIQLNEFIDRQVADSNPKIKKFFEQAIKDWDKDLHEEAERAKVQKLINSLGESEKNEIRKIRKDYDKEAKKLGLDHLIQSKE